MIGTYPPPSSTVGCGPHDDGSNRNDDINSTARPDMTESSIGEIKCNDVSDRQGSTKNEGTPITVDKFVGRTDKSCKFNFLCCCTDQRCCELSVYQCRKHYMAQCTHCLLYAAVKNEGVVSGGGCEVTLAKADNNGQDLRSMVKIGEKLVDSSDGSGSEEVSLL